MNVAIIGCGYVAAFYAQTLPNWKQLNFIGAWDTNESNLAALLKLLPGRQYASETELLGDSNVQLVLNLTNPRAHYEITKRCLEAGKHVYSEKPLAMSTDEASELAQLASEKGLCLSSAPCSILSDTAQTLWSAVRNGTIGKVRLVYASFEDGMIAPHAQPWTWTNGHGVHWPAKDEFEIGCTYEHAGYVLTWLAAMFGPAQSITSFASTQIPDKGIAVDSMAPDFTVGCITYSDGIVARVTCGLVAPKDKSITVIGDNGVLSVENVRHDRAPVYLVPTTLTGWRKVADRIWSKLCSLLGRPASKLDLLWRIKLPFTFKTQGPLVNRTKTVDFCRGPSEMADAISKGQPARLSADLGVHITELVECLQFPSRNCSESARQLRTTHSAIQPFQL